MNWLGNIIWFLCCGLWQGISWLVAPNQGFFPKYDAGLYTGGGTNMVVSRGLGNGIIPLRFNNRPEIVLVELIAYL